MPEIHFFGFCGATRSIRDDVTTFLKQALQTNVQEPSERLAETEFEKILRSIRKNVVTIEHAVPVLTLDNEAAPYIMITSTEEKELVVLTSLLRGFPGRIDIVEGALLRRFISKQT